MKKLFCLILTLVVISTLFLIPMSAKEYTPPRYARRGLCFKDSPYAYPIYSMTDSGADGLIDPNLLPGFTDLYGDDDYLQLKINNEGNTYSNGYIEIVRSTSNIKISFVITNVGNGKTYTYDFYDGVGYDFVIQWGKETPEADNNIYISVRDDLGNIIHSSYVDNSLNKSVLIYGLSTAQYLSESLPQGYSILYGLPDQSVDVSGVHVITQAFGGLVYNVGVGIGNGFTRLMFPNGHLTQFGIIMLTLVGLIIGISLIHLVIHLFKRRGK